MTMTQKVIPQRREVVVRCGDDGRPVVRWRIACWCCNRVTFVWARAPGEAAGKLMDAQGYAACQRPEGVSLLCANCAARAKREAEAAKAAKKAWGALTPIERLGWTLLMALSPTQKKDVVLHV